MPEWTAQLTCRRLDRFPGCVELITTSERPHEPVSEHYDVDELPRSWQERFAFFSTYGLPSSSPEAREAYKQLSFGSRLRINSNIWAFLFAPVYFFVKGMWRKGLTLLAAALVLGAVLVWLDVPDSWGHATGIGFAGLQMTIANYAYYLHVVKGSRSWNPLEGFGRRTARV